MILVGQYDSPYVRRVAVALLTLGIAYEHDTRSVFGEFDSMRKTNPLGRIPSLVLNDGEVLIDSAAILDYIDETVGPERALLPRTGRKRRQALKRIALATGAIDKIGSYNYERLIRPPALRWQSWMDRCLTQALGAVAALEAETWAEAAPLDMAAITVGCMLDYMHLTAPDLLPGARYPALDALWRQLSARPKFRQTASRTYNVPRGG